MKKFLLVSMILGLSIPSVHALDKQRLANHILKALNESTQTPIKIDDPKPSGFKDLDEVSITIHNQTQVILVSKDESKYIWGTIFDLSVDPDEERMAKINDKEGHYKGSKSAPVTIFEFSDLQCGYCKKAHFALERELYKNYSKKDVRLVFKHFPLRMHKWAFDGAKASTCAGQQDKNSFWGMIDYLFKNAQSITPENVKDIALEYVSDSGISKKQFNACFEGKKVDKIVKAHLEEGRAVGVRSTPSFFINGRMVRGFRDFDTFKALIDEKLAEAKK